MYTRCVPPTRPENKWLAANVRRLRTKRGWSQEELAHRAGLSGRAVSVVELAKTDVMLDTILRLAEALETTPAALLKATKNLKVPTLTAGVKSGAKKADG